MPGPLAKLIRSKYPGQYDDMDDISLEKAILAKYPDYADLANEEEEFAPLSGVSFEPVKPEIIEPEIPEEKFEPITGVNFKNLEVSKILDENNPEISQAKRYWDEMNAPTTDVTSRAARSFSEKGLQPLRKNVEDPFLASVMGFQEGALEGAGDLVSSLTSPLNLIAALLSGGSSIGAKAGLPALGRALGIGGRIASAPVAAHGGINLAHPDSTLEERLMGLVELAGGGAGMMQGLPKGKLPEIASEIAQPVSRAKSSTDIPGIEPRINELLIKARNEQILPEEMIELRELTGAPEVTELPPARDNSPFQYEDQVLPPNTATQSDLMSGLMDEIPNEPILTQNPDGSTSFYSRSPELPSETPFNQRGVTPRSKPGTPFTPPETPFTSDQYTAETIASDIAYLKSKGQPISDKLLAQQAKLGQAAGPTPEDVVLDNFNRSVESGQFSEIPQDLAGEFPDKFADQVIPSENIDIFGEHVTTIENAKAIKEQGFKPNIKGFGQNYGPGVYISLDSPTTKFYSGEGLETLKTVANIKKPFEISVETPRQSDPMMFVEQHQEFINGPWKGMGERPETLKIRERSYEIEAADNSGSVNGKALAMQEYFIQQGHDGIVIKQKYPDADVGGNQLIVFDPKKVSSKLPEKQFADQVIPPNEADMINQSFNESAPQNFINEGTDIIDPSTGEVMDMSIPQSYQDISGNNPLYHGTRDVFENFDVSKNQPHGLFPDKIRFTEDAEYSGMYSLGEGKGKKRDFDTNWSPKRDTPARPNTIPAIPNAKNVLDLTQPITPKNIKTLQNTFPDIPDNATSDFVFDVLKHSKEEIPFDAIRFSEHGVNNWAVSPEVDIRTPGGTRLTGAAQETRHFAGPERAVASERSIPKGKLRLKVSKGEYIDLDTGEAIPLNDPRLAKEIEVKPTPPSERMSPEIEAPPKPSIILEGMGFFKGIASSYDMSFPFRQGLGAIHTKGWWNAWGDSIKSIGEESSYQAVVESIKERPNFQTITDAATGKVKPSFAQEAGLAITDLDHLATREENIGSKWAEKIPGIRASNRGFNAFALKVRADNFDNLIEQAERIYQTARETGKAKRGVFTEKFGPDQVEQLNPRTNMILAKDIARFVNASTGRGGLGKVLEPAAQALGTALFSPRFIASRLKYMDPRVYIGADPFVRKQYLKSIMAIAGAWTAVGTLGKMAGGEVNLDSNSSDFLKIKIGNTRLDPGAGFQQYLVLLSRLASQSRTSSSKESYGKNTDYGHGYKAPTWGEDLTKFIRNKLSPGASFISDPFFASEKYPFEVGDRAVRMFAPMIVQDLSELAQEDPMLIPLLIPTGVGLGSQTYGEKEPNRFLGSMFPRRNDMMFPSR